MFVDEGQNLGGGSCSAHAEHDSTVSSATTIEEAAAALNQAEEEYNSQIVISNGNRWIDFGDVKDAIQNGLRYPVLAQNYASASSAVQKKVVIPALRVREYNHGWDPSGQRGIYLWGHVNDRELKLDKDVIQKVMDLATVIHKAADTMNQEMLDSDRRLEAMRAAGRSWADINAEVTDHEADRVRDAGWLAVREGIKAINEGCYGYRPSTQVSR